MYILYFSFCNQFTCSGKLRGIYTQCHKFTRSLASLREGKTMQVYTDSQCIMELSNHAVQVYTDSQCIMELSNHAVLHSAVLYTGSVL